MLALVRSQCFAETREEERKAPTAVGSGDLLGHVNLLISRPFLV